MFLEKTDIVIKIKCLFPDIDDKALRNDGGAFNTYLCSAVSKAQEPGFIP